MHSNGKIGFQGMSALITCTPKNHSVLSSEKTYPEEAQLIQKQRNVPQLLNNVPLGTSVYGGDGRNRASVLRTFFQVMKKPWWRLHLATHHAWKNFLWKGVLPLSTHPARQFILVQTLHPYLSIQLPSLHRAPGISAFWAFPTVPYWHLRLNTFSPYLSITCFNILVFGSSFIILLAKKPKQNKKNS